MQNSISLILLLLTVKLGAVNYYVSTSGSDSNNGTGLSAPFASITKGISVLQAGDVLYVRGGTYAYSAKISLTKNGSSDNPIRLEAYQGEKVIVDFSSMSTSSSNRGFSLSGDYWTIKGLHIHKAGDNGMFISGNYNTIEQCVFFANRDTGLQLGNGASNNNIMNCDSYGNADPTDYGDADGFACKMDVGDNNYFYGCRAWLNVDDGWDGYLRGTDDVNTIIENCWTWMNGYFLDGSDGGASANGNGFKVGGSDDKTLMHNFTLINCVAFDNKSKGFDQNNNKGDMFFYNCTGFRNQSNNYSIPLALNSGKVAEVVNCIAIDGKISHGSFVLEQTNSWDGFSFTNSDFVSLDTTGVSGARQTDGSLPNINLFKLIEGSSMIDAGTDLGYAYNGDAPDLGAFESDYGSTDIVDETENGMILSLLSNPVYDHIPLRIESDWHVKAELQVIAINGIVSHSQALNVVPGVSEHRVDTQSLSHGLYLLVLKTDRVIYSRKIIVSNR